MQWEHVDVTVPLTHDNFVNTLMRYPIVVVNFYAPWWVLGGSWEESF